MTDKNRKASPPDALEIAATTASVVLIVALLAFLVWDASQTSHPASFETRIERAEQRGGRIYVPVVVHNHGDEAARMVQVKVSADGSARGDESHFTIEWLPGRSSRRGVALVSAGIAPDGLKAEVEGYSEP